jgi:hypothetical protein
VLVVVFVLWNGKLELERDEAIWQGLLDRARKRLACVFVLALRLDRGRCLFGFRLGFALGLFLRFALCFALASFAAIRRFSSRCASSR